MAGPGHNRGPTLEPGHLWRAHQWRSAQRALMPNAVPLMIVRMRMKRAAELGLDYKAYARVRQTSGQDILGLLFSSNALRIIGAGARMPDAEDRALSAVRGASKLALVYPPNTPTAVREANGVLDATDVAPGFTETWAQMRDRIQGLIRTRKLPGSAVLVIGDAPLESDWTTAGRAAGYLSAREYFSHQAG